MRPAPDTELEGEVFENESFRGEDLSGLLTRNCVFHACDFGNAKLNGSEHVGSDFANSRFEAANLFGATFEECRLLGCDFAAGSAGRGGSTLSSGCGWSARD